MKTLYDLTTELNVTYSTIWQCIKRHNIPRHYGVSSTGKRMVLLDKDAQAKLSQLQKKRKPIVKKFKRKKVPWHLEDAFMCFVREVEKEMKWRNKNVK